MFERSRCSPDELKSLKWFPLRTFFATFCYTFWAWKSKTFERVSLQNDYFSLTQYFFKRVSNICFVFCQPEFFLSLALEGSLHCIDVLFSSKYEMCYFAQLSNFWNVLYRKMATFVNFGFLCGCVQCTVMVGGCVWGRGWGRYIEHSKVCSQYDFGHLRFFNVKSFSNQIFELFRIIY
jgi:hypothetical protein